ncbi:MAG: insulinase family protein [Nitrospinae bacterium]|nr:insulinase family protein [Nitrospinota bacterium]
MRVSDSGGRRFLGDRGPARGSADDGGVPARLREQAWVRGVDMRRSRARPSAAGPLRTLLDNGLTVILQENHAAPVVAFNMWVKVGSVHETDAEAGISHMYEHMLFKGTATRGVGEIAQEVEGAGGDINAYTSFDHTVYHITLASRFFDTGLAVMADAIQHSSFDPEELGKEQEVVLEEIKRGEDIPRGKLTEALFATSYQRHPYRRPVIGYEHTVTALTREHILSFFHTWYVPNNMVLVVSGDFQAAEVLPHIQAAFAAFRPGPLPALHIPQEPAQRELRTVILSDTIQETLLNLAYHVPSALHEDSYAMDVLAFILGGGESARLYQTVKAEQGLVHSVYAYPFLPKDPGVLILGATLEGTHWREALRGVIGEVECLQHERVTAAELEKAKHNLESEFIYQRETVQGQANSMGYFDAVLGDLAFETRYLKGIARVTTRDLTRVAQTYLTPDNLSVAFFLPDADRSRVTQADISQAAQPSARPRRPRRRHAPAAARTTHTSVLENGMRLLVRENHAVPLVSMQAVFLGGVRIEDAAHSGVTNFIAGMLTKGTTRRSALALADQIESLAGELSGFAGRNSFGVSAEMLSRSTRQGLELLAEVILHPTFEPGELEKKRVDLLAAIKREEDDLFQLTFNLLVQTLFPKHPYGLKVLGTPESVSRLTRDDLLAWYRRYAMPNNLVLAVVGDVEAGVVQEEVAHLFGPWSAGALSLPPPGRDPQPIPGGRAFLQREKEQTHILVGMRGTSVSNPDRYPLRVLDSILSSQGGRLFVELREKRSLAYTVTARSLEGLDPFVFFIYLATSPEKVDAALEGIRAELAKVREQGVTPQEVERAKQYLVGSYEIELQKNSSQAATLAFHERYGLGSQELEAYTEKILSVTPEVVQQVARAYLSLEQCTVAIVGPSPSREAALQPASGGVAS